MSDKDMVIGLMLNDTPFTRAMDKARARMKQTIAEMEQSSKMSLSDPPLTRWSQQVAWWRLNQRSQSCPSKVC